MKKIFQVRYCLSIIVIFLFNVSIGQNIVGKWKTIDDVTGKPRSIVEIFEKNNLFYGKVSQIYYKPNEKENPVCELCDVSDPRRNKKVIGMEIIQHLKKVNNEWKNGTILDPDNGKVYDCKLWVEDGKLQVRGYIFCFFRTQTWLPFK